MTGFAGECFHVFNKHASAAEVKPYFQTEEVSAVCSLVPAGPCCVCAWVFLVSFLELLLLLL